MGIGACILTLLVAMVAAWWATQQPVGLGLFAGLLLAVASSALSVLFAIWTLGYYTLHYTLGAHELTVGWLLREDRVPYAAIGAVYSGNRLAERPVVRGIVWPGNYVGRARARNLGVLQVFATTLVPARLTVLVTDVGSYALSAEDGFRAALVERLEALDAEAPLKAFPGPRRQPLVRALADRWLLAGALTSALLLLAMVGALIERYEALPELLTTASTAGADVPLRSRFELFQLPAAGAVVLLMDVALGMALYSREVLAARLVWVAPVLVQLVLGAALLRALL